MTRISSVSFDQLLDIRAHPNHGDYYEIGLFSFIRCCFVYKQPATKEKNNSVAIGKPTITKTECATDMNRAGNSVRMAESVCKKCVCLCRVLME